MPEKQDIMYKMYLENKEPEIKHLWKLNFVNFSLLMPNIGFEQKISKLWSVEGYASYGYDVSNNIFGATLGLNPESYAHYPSFEVEQLFKFYYLNKIKERKGVKTKGFSGYYFATSILYEQNQYDGSRFGKDSLGLSLHNINYNETNLKLGIKYGIQRRIGNYVNIEIYAGIYYICNWEKSDYNQPGVTKLNYSHVIEPFGGIRFGFAIGSFDNLKKKINK